MDDDSGKGEWQGFVYDSSRMKGYCIAWCGTSLSVEHLRLLSAPRCYKLSKMEKALPPAMHVELHMYVQGPRS